MAEYGSMYTVSGLAAVLFFGGWNGPVPIFDILGWSYTPDELASGTFRVTGYLANLAGCLNFMFKALVGVTVMMWIRWSLPRLRIDQVMATCLKYCVPIAAVCFAGTVLWQYGFFVTDKPLPSLNNLIPAAPRATVREAWTIAVTKTGSSAPTTSEPTPAGPEAEKQEGQSPAEGGAVKEAAQTGAKVTDPAASTEGAKSERLGKVVAR
jgi:NADH-quinone oxidoreductase subunit H